MSQIVLTPKKNVMLQCTSTRQAFFVPVRFKTQGTCHAAVCIEPLSLPYVRNRCKSRKMCDKAVMNDRFSLLFVPDWFVTKQQVQILTG